MKQSQFYTDASVWAAEENKTITYKIGYFYKVMKAILDNRHRDQIPTYSFFLVVFFLLFWELIDSLYKDPAL